MGMPNLRLRSKAEHSASLVAIRIRNAYPSRTARITAKAPRPPLDEGPSADPVGTVTSSTSSSGRVAMGIAFGCVLAISFESNV